MTTLGGGVPGLERLRTAIATLESSNQALITELNSSLVMFKMVAEDLERDNNPELVEQLSQATTEMISLADEVVHHSSCLQYVGQNYKTDNDQLTDFQKLIEGRMEQLKADNPSKPEDHPYYKQFKEAVWNVHHTGQPTPGQENEDLVMTCSQFSVVNTKCPLTGKPVVELEDPVRSSDCRHIYDRAAVMDHIKRQGRRRPCLCAAAGCPKILVAENLICDPMLKIEIQEMRMRGRVSTQAHEVADYTELED